MTITAQQLWQGLDTNSKWVERAIVVLYERQTKDEQRTSSTRVHNKMGFASCDARSGTYMAKWVLSGKHLDGKWLEKARKMAKKYTRQLLEAAAEKEARENPPRLTPAVIEMAAKLGIPLEKLDVAEIRPEDICGIPTRT